MLTVITSYSIHYTKLYEIYQGGLTGILAYKETFVEISDINGMVNLEIGRGTPVVGVFSEIPWGNGRFFISVAADPRGGTDRNNFV